MKTVKVFLVLIALLIFSGGAYATPAVSIPGINADAGASVEIPVDANLDIKIGGFQFTITYNPAVLNCTSASAGTLTSGWFLEQNPTAGQYIVLGLDLSGNGTGPGTGSLVKLQCTAIGSAGASTAVSFGFAEVGDEFANPITPLTTPGTFTINGGQCIPSAEICDGQDNDCDGLIDEDLTRETSCGVGACAATGTETCAAGVWSGDTCTPGIPQTEGPFGNATCSDQIDNDCDGAADAADTGCAEECVPSEEVCDGIDNDCDGQVDEDIAPVASTCGVGACAATGQQTCVGGQLIDSCTPGTPQTEGPLGDATCNDQIDNDCDGATDDADTDCGGACVPSEEVCDGIDNDCDGQVDEDIAPVASTCGVGACAATGQQTCVGGQLIDSCTPGTPQTEGPLGDATCNDQIDNDCDGAADSADSGCMQSFMQQPPPDLSNWVGQWFKITGNMTGKTFNAWNSTFSADKDRGIGYMNIWRWDPGTGDLHFDYYEFLHDTGIWDTHTDILHYFAGTELRFLFWHESSQENAVMAITGEMIAKEKNGQFKSAKMKTLGGFYADIDGSTTQYSAGKQIINGMTIDAEKVPVPFSSRLQH